MALRSRAALSDGTPAVERMPTVCPTLPRAEGRTALRQGLVRAAGRQTHGKGEHLRVTLQPHAVHLFSAKTGLRLPADETSV
ncbi:hypothetical protein ACWIID_14535 [Streptomyces phaeochromogenes]